MTGPDPLAPADGAAAGRMPNPGIGGLLREARQQFNLDLGDVAARLRIRRAYLEAIEDGRYGDLPATVYVVGFARTYAQFLGLDADGLIAQFHSEISEAGRRPELRQQVPPPEPRFLSGPLVLVSALLVITAFVGWQVLNDAEFPPQDAPLPDAVGSGAPAPADRPADVAADVATEVPAANPADSAAAGTGDLPADPPADIAAPQSGAAAGAPPAAARSGPPPEIPETRPARDTARVPGGAARIVVIARVGGWIQIVDGGSGIVTRVLAPGERYRVPDRDGLVLRAGNAGGLRIEVDGVEVPPLGAPGEGLSGAVLDPDLLRAGRAVTP